MVKTYNKKNDISKQLSKNFKLSEFDCKCKRCDEVLLDSELVELLQKIRDHFGVPVNVNSGYRCKAHNKEVGGSTSSHHVRGTAADIRVEGVEPKEVAKYAESIGIQRIGLYEGDQEGNFVHIGSESTKKFWLGHAGTRVDTFGAAPVKTIDMEITVLKRGMKGDIIKPLQMLLVGYGADIEVDGSFGAATESAVKAYQREHGLKDDGSVGAKTWASLLDM
jgi:hypothetical protein